MAKTSSETQRRKSRAARKGKWPPRGTGNRQAPPILEAQVTGKAGENGQNSGEMGGISPWTRPSAPECGDTLPASDLGWGSSSKTVPGSLSTGSLAGRTPSHGDGSMYSQANVTDHIGWKGVRPVRLESRPGEPVRSPKNTSAAKISFDRNKGRFSKD